MLKSSLDALTLFDSVQATGGFTMNTAKKLQINDDEISNILSLREMKKALSKKLEKLDSELKKEERKVMELIEFGAENYSEFNISINESFKTYPKYKEEILKRYGEDVVKEIINSTQPQQFKKLVIAS